MLEAFRNFSFLSSPQRAPQVAHLALRLVWSAMMNHHRAPDPCFASAADVGPIHEHANAAAGPMGGSTYGRASHHRAACGSSCNAGNAHRGQRRPTLACALSTDSEGPPLGDHPGDTRVATARTAAAKNVCLMVICVIPSSFVYQADDSHPGRAPLI